MKPLILASYFADSAPALPQILARILPEKKIEGLNVLTITTAANPYGQNTGKTLDWLEKELSALRSIGLHLDEYDLTNQSIKDVHTKVINADIIYITGGNTYYLLEQAQKCNFKEAVDAALEKNVIYMGSSAGSALACPRIDYIEDMDEPEKAENLTNFTGLNLTPFYIMPHANDEKYGPVGREIIQKTINKTKHFITLHDSQIALITHNNVEIFPHS